MLTESFSMESIGVFTDDDDGDDNADNDDDDEEAVSILGGFINGLS